MYDCRPSYTLYKRNVNGPYRELMRCHLNSRTHITVTYAHHLLTHFTLFLITCFIYFFKEIHNKLYLLYFCFLNIVWASNRKKIIKFTVLQMNAMNNNKTLHFRTVNLMQLWQLWHFESFEIWIVCIGWFELFREQKKIIELMIWCVPQFLYQRNKINLIVLAKKRTEIKVNYKPQTVII